MTPTQASRRTRGLAELHARASDLARAPQTRAVDLDADIHDLQVLQEVADELVADAELLSAVLGESR